MRASDLSRAHVDKDATVPTAQRSRVPDEPLPIWALQIKVEFLADDCRIDLQGAAPHFCRVETMKLGDVTSRPQIWLAIPMPVFPLEILQEFTNGGHLWNLFFGPKPTLKISSSFNSPAPTSQRESFQPLVGPLRRKQNDERNWDAYHMCGPRDLCSWEFVFSMFTIVGAYGLLGATIFPVFALSIAA
jgi:hypothetical protein